MIAARPQIAREFLCFTTHRNFDGELKSPWHDAAGRLSDLLQRETGATPHAVVFAGQVHSHHVHTVSEISDSIVRIENCDGLVTAQPGVYLVIRTADCLPVALVDEETRVCAVLHAGWRGSLANILACGIEAMEALGADRRRIRGWIGPAITRRHYQVSEELADSFRARHGELGNFTHDRQLDLPQLNVLQAAGAGLSPQSIQFCGLCTYERDDLFHSHRRQGMLRGHQYTVGGFPP